MNFIDICIDMFIRLITVSLITAPVFLVFFVVRGGLARMCVSASVRCKMWALPTAVLIVVWFCAGGVFAGTLVSTDGALGDGAPLAAAVQVEGSGGVQSNAAADWLGEEAAGNSFSDLSMGSAEPSSDFINNSYIISAAAVVWIIISAVILTAAFVENIRFHRNLRFSIAVDYFDSSAVLGRNFTIYESTEVNSPFVSGIFRPRIYMPPNLDQNDFTNILAHEAEHIKRNDCLMLLIIWIWCALNWFNPLFWIAFLAFRNDLEMRCDEAAVKEQSMEEKSAYMMTLLSMSASGKKISFSPGFVKGESDTEMRVKNLVTNKKHRPALTAAASVICVIAAALCIFVYQWYEKEYYNLNDIDMITVEQVEKLLKVNGLEIKPDSEYDEYDFGIALNGYPVTSETAVFPDIYSIHTDGCEGKLFIYCFNEYVTYGYNLTTHPFNDKNFNDTTLLASIEKYAGKNIVVFPYFSHDACYSEFDAGNEGEIVDDSNLQELTEHLNKINNTYSNLSDILFYKAFCGKEEFWKGSSAKWNMAVKVKSFSLEYTDSEGNSSISCLKKTAAVLLNYDDGNPEQQFQSVSGYDLKYGTSERSATWNGNNFQFSLSDELDGMYSCNNFNFKETLQWYTDYFDVSLKYNDGTETVITCSKPV